MKTNRQLMEEYRRNNSMHSAQKFDDIDVSILMDLAVIEYMNKKLDQLKQQKL